jgi:catechol 2,3-dioxygenase-like lactoylglutathione lyase family enzyme
MEVREIDRVLVATNDIDDAVDRFEELLGLSFGNPIDSATPDGEGQVRVSISDHGLEFVTPKGRGGGLSNYLETYGAGLYAISLRVRDAEAAKAELAEKGVKPLGVHESDAITEIVYSPADFGGLMVILSEYSVPHPVQLAVNQDIV